MPVSILPDYPSMVDFAVFRRPHVMMRLGLLLAPWSDLTCR